MINYLFEAVGYTYKRNDAGIYDVLDEILLIDKLSKNHYVTLYALYQTLGASQELLNDWRRANKLEIVKPSYGFTIDPLTELLHWGLISEIKHSGTKRQQNSAFGVSPKGERILQLIEATMRKTNGNYTPPSAPTFQFKSNTASATGYDYSCIKNLFAKVTEKNPVIFDEYVKTALDILDSFGKAGDMYQMMFSLYHNLDVDIANFKSSTHRKLKDLGCVGNVTLTAFGKRVFVKVIEIKAQLDDFDFTEHKLLNSPAMILSKLIMECKVPSNSTAKTLAAFYPYAVAEGYLEKHHDELTPYALELHAHITKLDKARRAQFQNQRDAG